MGITGVFTGAWVVVIHVVFFSSPLTDCWIRFSGFGLGMLLNLANLVILGDFDERLLLDCDLELYLDLDLDLDLERELDMAGDLDLDIDLLLDLDFEEDLTLPRDLE